MQIHWPLKWDPNNKHMCIDTECVFKVAVTKWGKAQTEESDIYKSLTNLAKSFDAPVVSYHMYKGKYMMHAQHWMIMKLNVYMHFFQKVSGYTYVYAHQKFLKGLKRVWKNLPVLLKTQFSHSTLS